VFVCFVDAAPNERLGLALHARDFGLAFASAHLAHVGLVAWLYYIAVDPPLSK
jgi:hypothetical protein